MLSSGNCVPRLPGISNTEFRISNTEGHFDIHHSISDVHDSIKKGHPPQDVPQLKLI